MQSTIGSPSEAMTTRLRKIMICPEEEEGRSANDNSMKRREILYHVNFNFLNDTIFGKKKELQKYHMTSRITCVRTRIARKVSASKSEYEICPTTTKWILQMKVRSDTFGNVVRIIFSTTLDYDLFSVSTGCRTDAVLSKKISSLSRRCLYSEDSSIFSYPCLSSRRKLVILYGSRVFQYFVNHWDYNCHISE